MTERAERALTADDLPPPLYNKLLHYFGSIANARRLAGLAQPPRKRKWTLDRVIREVRQLHRAGIWIRVSDLSMCGRHDLVGAIHAVGGGIRKVRRVAGIPAPPRPIVYPEPWDDDRVISEIRERARLGQSLAYSRAPRKLTGAGRRRFGSWRNAVEVAGLDYDAVRLVRAPYTEEELLQGLRKLAVRRPRMTSSDLQAHPIAQALRTRRRSLAATVKRLGIVDWPVRLTHDVMTANEVRRALRAKHASGGAMTLRAIQQDDLRLVLAIRRHYRGIEGALTATKLTAKVERQTRWTRDEVLRQLRQRRDRGLSLDASVVNRDRQILYVKARELFGSYFAAAKRYGAKRKTQTWTRERVVLELRKIGRGRETIKTSDARMALQKACKYHFGNFGAARRAAGLVGPAISPPWSRATVIEALRERVATGRKLEKAFQTTARRQFGSVDAALFAAGVGRDPRAPAGLRIVRSRYW